MNSLKSGHGKIRHFISAPFIYSVFLPVIIVDIWVELYHRITFPLFGLPYVQRDAYIRVDRQKLAYLNWFQKINCMYCGYVNGVFAYWVAIAGATEQYWCGIKHEAGDGFVEPTHHEQFLEYNDEDAFRERYT